MTSDEALALIGVRRTFGTTVALDAATCVVRRGTIHALLGENGAGKTTLMRIAFGMLRADAGELRVAGRPVRFRSSADAIACGLGMVHQHFMLVPALTVAENVALGGRGRFDPGAAAERVRQVGRETGLNVDPVARVRDLPVGAQQRLEIVKALAHEARVLILDEPTAVLAPDDSAELARWLRSFAAQGGTVVLITHKLHEALALADDVTVLRRGRTTCAAPRSEVDAATVVAALTGEDAFPSQSAPRRAVPSSRDPILALDRVNYTDAGGVARLRDVSLAVRGGEILGVLGVEGSGPRELLRILAGRLAPTVGRVQRPARVGFIPEDRLHDALIPGLSLTENLALAEAGQLRGLIDWPALATRTRTMLKAFDVHAAGPAALASTLSGGNQQKFVVGRERQLAGAALVAENPTQGLDIRSTALVLDAIGSMEGGAERAVVFHSADLDEVLALATRVVVCFDGRVREVAAPADPEDRTPYTRAMVGAF